MRLLPLCFLKIAARDIHLLPRSKIVHGESIVVSSL
jgi:hypothetical protein